MLYSILFIYLKKIQKVYRKNKKGYNFKNRYEAWSYLCGRKESLKDASRDGTLEQRKDAALKKKVLKTQEQERERGENHIK